MSAVGHEYMAFQDGTTSDDGDVSEMDTSGSESDYIEDDDRATGSRQDPERVHFNGSQRRYYFVRSYPRYTTNWSVDVGLFCNNRMVMCLSWCAKGILQCGPARLPRRESSVVCCYVALSTDELSHTHG